MPPSHRERALLRHATDAVVELGIDGRLLYVSPAIEPILARPPEFFVGRSFVEVIVPEDRAATLAAFQKIVATGAEPTVHFRVPRSDGLRVEFEARVRSFEEGDGPRRVVAVLRDVTEQSAQSAVARKRDDHYRTIVESGGRPAAILDRSGAVLFSNRAFKTAFGHEVSVHDLFPRMSDDVRQAMETVWYDSVRLDRPGRGAGDFVYENDDGTESWYAASWEPFQTEDEQRNFAVVYEDITARKQVELALRSIAKGVAVDGREGLEQNLVSIGRALGLDRIVLAGIAPDDPGHAHVAVGFEDGEPMARERFALGQLPDATAAGGDACVFPSGVSALVPEVAERLSPTFESYAGQPLHRADGVVIGFVGGYGRQPILDADLVRSLLSAFATHAAAAIDRQRADAEIRANQHRFEALSRQHHELLIEIDERGRILFASEASLPMLGFTPQEMIGRSIPQMVHPDDRAANREFQKGLFTGEGQSFAINRIEHQDGTYRWLESRSSSFDAPEGTLHALIVSRDVTDRRRTEFGRDLLYRVVQEGTDLVFICDTDTTLRFANDAASRRLGASFAPGSEPRVEGPHLDELLSTVDAARLENEILPLLTPAQPWSGELHLRNPAGEAPIPTEATVFLFLGEREEDASYLAVTLRDIGARRSAEEALRESELRLNQAQKMEAVGRLAGGIAHDFNNLLTAIIGYSDLVLDELGEGHGARRDAEEILRAAERAGGLTRQLLAFSRRQVLQPEPVDLNAVVADIDRMMRRLIGENIELVTLQDGELRSIIADPGQIEQVIVNLVVNARDAMPQGGRLQIETANHVARTDRRTESGVVEAGNYVLLRVSDTGIGMDDDTRAQIFEPFFTTKETHQGTGLGLASVYGIVSQSGGQIDVDSTPGAGTSFTIYFPVAATGAATDDTSTDKRQIGGNETILLVEDADPVRRLVRRTLEKSGYRVLCAESATAALRHCARHEGAIDLLLSDVVLPKVAGPEIASRARELRPGIRVLFMSGFTDETLSRHGLDPTRAELIEKPFTPATLLTRIRTLLDGD
ncbi:MAG: PAS domain S-box protein [bacterium]|nr:PAS domain S-box protein [bacterium]